MCISTLYLCFVRREFLSPALPSQFRSLQCFPRQITGVRRAMMLVTIGVPFSVTPVVKAYPALAVGQAQGRTLYMLYLISSS